MTHSNFIATLIMLGFNKNSETDGLSEWYVDAKGKAMALVYNADNIHANHQAVVYINASPSDTSVAETTAGSFEKVIEKITE